MRHSGALVRLLVAASRLSREIRLTALVLVILAAAFFGIAILSFAVSRDHMRDLIVHSELPLTSDTVYSQIQHDFIAPIQASGLMAKDTFLRDWALGGERDVNAVAKYLSEIQRANNAFTAYFVSAPSLHYYGPKGLFKILSHKDPHDGWFFDLEHAPSDFVIEVDTDQAHGNALTVFINYRMFDYHGRFIGVTGLGLRLSSVRQSIDTYEQEFGRTIYFVEQSGKVAMSGSAAQPFSDIRSAPGLSRLAPQILAGHQGAMSYTAAGETHLLNVRYIPELKWYLLVERVEDVAIRGVRQMLYVNLLIAALATALVGLVLSRIVTSHREEFERFATTDPLTGLLNRHAFDLLFRQVQAESRRRDHRSALVMFDIDHFKVVNDTYGHLAGDRVLKAVAETIRSGRREGDATCRWGGEEILLMLRDCELRKAVEIAEEIRERIARTPIPDGGNRIALTISAGVTEIGGKAEEAETVIARADQGLYAAKRGGRNRVVTVAR